MSFNCSTSLSEGSRFSSCWDNKLNENCSSDLYCKDLDDLDKDIWRVIQSPASEGSESREMDMGWPQTPKMGQPIRPPIYSANFREHSVPPLDSSNVLDKTFRHTKDDPSLVRRLHVSNIPFRFRDIDLRVTFEKFGPVAEAEIIYNIRGSKGFGFVTFARLQDALVAQQTLNNTFIEGRLITVSNATAKCLNPRRTATRQLPPNLHPRRVVEHGCNPKIGCFVEPNQFMVAMAMAFAFAETYNRTRASDHLQYMGGESPFVPRPGMTFPQ